MEAPESRRRRLFVVLYAALTGVLLGGLYWSLETSPIGHHPAAARSRTYGLSVSAYRPDKELPTFRATQGDSVTLELNSDLTGTAHLHGYEQSVDLEPGTTVTLRFIAKNAGLFPLHLHMSDGSMYPLATFEVQPR